MGRVPEVGVVLLAVAVSDAAMGASIRVPDHYATIEAALVALASSSDPSNTITVEPGTYSVNLTLLSNLTLQGSETSRVILTAANPAEPILRADTVGNVRISGFSFTGDSPAISSASSNTLTISNNVFRVGTGHIAVSVTSPGADVSVINNTFVNVGTGVARDSDSVVITNNVFSDSTTAISAASSANISFNGFFSNTSNGQTGSNSVSGGSAGFAQTSAGDFHLVAGSAAINAGTGTDTLDGTTADLGAFGGADADILPFPVQGVTATASNGGAAITVAWSDNQDYRVAGYRVHYGASSGSYTGTNAQSASPLEAGDVTTLQLTGFTGSGLAAPADLSVVAASEMLRFAWSPVSGATGYRLHYGLAAISEHQVDVGNVTQFELTGLTNGTSYVAAVTARRSVEQQVYVAVSAVDGTAASNESARTAEASVVVNATEASVASNQVSGQPQSVDMYPSLSNDGCFIATAAFGYYDASEVQALRDFRDRYLKTNQPGRAFVGWYYRHSPPAAQWLNEHPAAKPVIRGVLMPAVLMSGVFTGRTSPWPSGISFFLVMLAGALALHVRFQRGRVPA